MARTALTVAVISRNGVAATAPATSDVSNGNSFPNDGATLVQVTNSDAAAQTVKFTPAATVEGIAIVPVAHSQAAAAVAYYGPFPTSIYGSVLAVDCSTTTVHLAAYKLPSN